MPELIEALSGHRRRSHDGRAFQKGPLDQRSDILFDQVDPRGVDEIALGHDDHSSGKAEQPEDFEVFPSLGHDRVISGDDEHGEVKARCACEHVPDESLVTRYVDQCQAEAAQLQGREAQIDGDPPLFLGRQAVGVDTRERAHESRLAVVDVACRAQHQVLNAVAHCFAMERPERDWPPIDLVIACQSVYRFDREAETRDRLVLAAERANQPGAALPKPGDRGTEPPPTAIRRGGVSVSDASCSARSRP